MHSSTSRIVGALELIGAGWNAGSGFSGSATTDGLIVGGRGGKRGGVARRVLASELVTRSG